MTSNYFANHNCESSWIATNKTCQIEERMEDKLKKITLVDNCAKNIVEPLIDNDQSLLSKKLNNLPDLLEETNSPDCLTMLNQQKNCITEDQKKTYSDCNHVNQITARSEFVDLHLLSDKEILDDMLLFSKDVQRDMGGIISQLQSQILNLISRYKVLKNKNIMLEHKLKILKNENVCKLCRKKKVLKDKSMKKPGNLNQTEEIMTEKQITEDSLPSPPRLDPQLLAKISNILSQSENFLKPVEQSITTLELKMKQYQSDNDFETNRLSLTSDYENESDNSFSSTNFYSI